MPGGNPSAATVQGQGRWSSPVPSPNPSLLPLVAGDKSQGSGDRVPGGPNALRLPDDA